jgi:hypothetical protein
MLQFALAAKRSLRYQTLGKCTYTADYCETPHARKYWPGASSGGREAAHLSYPFLNLSISAKTSFRFGG